MSEEFSIKTIRTGDKTEDYISMSAFIGLEQDLTRTRKELEDYKLLYRTAMDDLGESYKLLKGTREQLTTFQKNFEHYKSVAEKSFKQLAIAKEALVSIRDDESGDWDFVTGFIAKNTLEKLNTLMPMGESEERTK